MQPQEYLQQIFPDFLDEGVFGIFTLPDAKMRWFQTPTEAGVYAEKQEKCTFFSVGVFPQTTKKKGKENDAIGLACLHVDVDIKHSVHQKDNLPATQEDALELINQGIPESPPTTIIHSGHGLQALWVFNEPWIFDNEDERLEAKQLAKRFHRTMAFAASGKGFGIDATFNLDRVLRVAGTRNYKDKNDPKDVTLIKSGGPLYNPDDFEDILVFIPVEELHNDQQNRFANGDENPLNLTLVETATPPTQKMDDLLENDPRFKLLWHKQLDVEKQRSKLKDDGSPGGDASLSSYDMSLANYTAIFGWKDQEIADLIIAFRRKHMTKDKDLKKALRLKYITDLILKARARVIKEERHQQLTNLHNKTIERQLDPDAEPLSENEIEKEKEEARDSLAEALKIRVDRINKYLSEPPFYEMLLADGTKIPIGSANQLLHQGNLRVKLFEVLSTAFSPQKKDRWSEAVTAFGKLIIPVETADETRDEGGMKVWIQGYLSDAGVWNDPDDAYLDRRPFRSNGRTYVFGESLKKHVNLKGEKLNDKNMGTLMSRIGCKHSRFTFTVDGENIRIRVYDVTAALEEGSK